MTEEVSSASDLPECNGTEAAGSAAVPIAGAIDGTSKTPSAVPGEQEAQSAASEGNEVPNEHESTNSMHIKGTDDTAEEIKACDGSTESESNSDITPENTNEFEDIPHEETQQEKHLGENDIGVDAIKEAQLHERETETSPQPAETDEGLEMEATNEESIIIESENENGEESGLYDQESDPEETPPDSPSYEPRSGSPGGQPGVGIKPEISKHNYSKYDTVSYRKIRKGNTKQRIDEFESMMNL